MPEQVRRGDGGWVVCLRGVGGGIWLWGGAGGGDGEGEGGLEGAEVVFDLGEGAAVGVVEVGGEEEDGASECGVGEGAEGAVEGGLGDAGGFGEVREAEDGEVVDFGDDEERVEKCSDGGGVGAIA